MRKVAFVSTDNTERIKKVMIYACHDGVYVFGYDTLYEHSGKFDYLYDSLEDAEEMCRVDYGVSSKDWITIADPQEFCQQDMIMPIRIKGRDQNKPVWGSFEIRMNGKWHEWHSTLEKEQPIGGLTAHERLFACGLLEEFEDAKRCKETQKANTISETLHIPIITCGHTS